MEKNWGDTPSATLKGMGLLYVIDMIQLQARASLIDKQYEADREKLHKIRLLLVRIAIL